jgi:hypothetical protein
MCVEDVSVSRRTGFLGDIWVPRDLVFVNGFRVSSSLCVLKISASARELGSRVDFYATATHFLLMVSASAVVYVP